MRRFRGFMSDLSNTFTITQSLWGIFSFIVIFLGGSIAAITAYLSVYFDDKSPFFFIALGLFFSFVLSIIFLFISYSFKTRTHASYIKMLSEIKDREINPLNNHFENRIISLSDLELPLNGAHERKIFKKCDIVGPGVICLLGGSFDHCDFINCGDVIFAPDESFFTGVIPLVGCNVIDCRLINITIITGNTPENIGSFSKMGGRCIVGSFSK